MASLAPQLRKAALRFEEVETQLAQPETYADPDLVAKLNREQKDLAPLVEAWQQYEKVQQDLAGLEELLEDPEYRPLAQAEQAQAQQELARLEATLRTLLRPKDPMEGKNVFLEIRAGVGGGGGRPLCRRPLPDVRHVWGEAGMEVGGGLHQPDRAGRVQGTLLPDPGGDGLHPPEA